MLWLLWLIVGCRSCQEWFIRDDSLDFNHHSLFNGVLRGVTADFLHGLILKWSIELSVLKNINYRTSPRRLTTQFATIQLGMVKYRRMWTKYAIKWDRSCSAKLDSSYDGLRALSVTEMEYFCPSKLEILDLLDLIVPH